MMPSRKPTKQKMLQNVYNLYDFNAHIQENDLNLNSSPQTLPTYQHVLLDKYNSKTLRFSKHRNMESNIEQTTGENWKRTFNDYCITSSLHGLKYVGDKRISLLERLFWLASFLSAAIVAVYFISFLFINYNHNPVQINFSPEMMYIQDMPFPAITICNIMVATQEKANLNKRTGTSQENEVLDGLCNAYNFSSRSSESILFETVENTINNVTQLCGELMVGCKWAGRLYNCRELINSVLTDDGYCCTFNKLPNRLVYRTPIPGKSKHIYPSHIVDWYPEAGYPADITADTYPYRALGRGVEWGLTLALNVNLHAYYCSATGAFGIKMMLHTPRESPKIADKGFLIKPGVESRIPLRLNIENASDSVRDVDYRKRGCFYADERKLLHYRIYNRGNCLLECESNYTLNTCGCSLFYLPRKKNTKICDKVDDDCVRRAKFVIERFGAAKLECNCLPGCVSINYWPHYISKASLMDINNITFDSFIGNFSREYFARNMAVVHIYYDSIRFRVLVKNTLYNFSQFLSNTGGILALFMGFSFLSAIEMVYFVYMRVFRNCCPRRNNNIRNNVITPFLE